MRTFIHWLAIWWIGVGILGLLFVAVFAVLTFQEGYQWYAPQIGQQISLSTVAWILTAMGVGFALFAGIGTLIVAKLRSRQTSD